ncbi:MAG: hypothetical protein ACRDRO_12700 [Pseudonocardiaceae bacterium]
MARSVEHAGTQPASGRWSGNPGYSALYPDWLSWIYLSLHTDGDDASSTVHCELIRRNGSTVPVGRFTLARVEGRWGGPAGRRSRLARQARVIDGSSVILATATLRAELQQKLDEHFGIRTASAASVL